MPSDFQPLVMVCADSGDMWIYDLAFVAPPNVDPPNDEFTLEDRLTTIGLEDTSGTLALE